MRACIWYLHGARHYLAYDQALAGGLPIATGVIEGACRYPVKDRMEKTGARGSLEGAEAVLRLRALRASGDFDAYWKLHLDREHARQHRARYAAGAPPLPIPALKPLLSAREMTGIEAFHGSRTLRQSHSYETAAGNVVVERTRYKDRADDEGRCVSPMDLTIGVIGDFWTPRAAQQALWVVSQFRR